MRVISGSARGRRLESPENYDIRPTTDKVKESLFNILQFELQNKVFLDLFSGSGQIGIEALSRGAGQAVFVDSSKKAIDMIRRNVQQTGFSDRAQIVCKDSFAFLSTEKQCFDIVFLDPPYHNQLIDRVFPLLAQRLTPDSVVVCECQNDEILPDSFGDFCKDREYKYSAIRLTSYRFRTQKKE